MSGFASAKRSAACARSPYPSPSGANAARACRLDRSSLARVSTASRRALPASTPAAKARIPSTATLRARQAAVTPAKSFPAQP